MNLGRGGIINETDLAFEMNRREIYTGLDVLETEPIEAFNPLNSLTHPDRLLITPHIAWTSIEAREKLIKGVEKNIKNFLETNPIEDEPEDIQKIIEAPIKELIQIQDNDIKTEEQIKELLQDNNVDTEDPFNLGIH